MLNNTKDILTIKDLQKLLHIGRNTALRLVQDGEIEGFKVGRQWRVTRESVVRYVKRM
ncbi:MAG: helix-turn-helix domain-containing protein [Oscillospiraceae bacterium]|nr:helix-turn-helix domain-containing protein [Oscillospiraceae bacterium]